MTDTFLDHPAEVIQAEITVGETGDDIVLEARANQWSFSLTPEQAMRVQPDQIVRFITAIVEAREAAILERYQKDHPLVFYCWFDEQAAQLRFSLVSAQHGSLPFGCRIRCATELTQIAEQFLQSPHHSGIPLGELVAERDNRPSKTAEPKEEDFVLEVWTVQLPRT